MQNINELIAQRDALEKQISDAKKNARQDAINQCRSLIQQFELTPTELGLKRLMRRANSVAPKYIGPQGQTWAGRGRKPVWLQEAEKEGKTMEDFAIRLK